MNKVRLVLVIATMFTAACAGSPNEPNSAPGRDGGAAVAEGAQLFSQAALGGQAGCNSCHSTSTSAFGSGPSLAEIGLTAGERVPGQTAEEYIRQSIVDPNAYLVGDYTRGLMPRNYADNLSADEIDSLVAYLLSLR